MRILKGYSKEEQKELEDAKRKYMNDGDLLHIITGILPDTRCGLIWKKYNKANKDERISIIRDILDFYTYKATFIVPKKYYVKLPKLRYPYLIQTNSGMNLTYHLKSVYKEKFTEQEIKDIDPRYMAFAIPVEEDDE